MANPLFDFGIAPTTLTLLGLAAGALVACSAVPALIDSIRRPVGDGWYQIARNTAAMTGNWIWTVFGLQAGHFPIAGFCGLSSMLLTVLTVLQLKRMLKKEKAHA